MIKDILNKKCECYEKNYASMWFVCHKHHLKEMEQFVRDERKKAFLRCADALANWQENGIKNIGELEAWIRKMADDG